MPAVPLQTRPALFGALDVTFVWATFDVSASETSAKRAVRLEAFPFSIVLAQEKTSLKKFTGR